MGVVRKQGHVYAQVCQLISSISWSKSKVVVGKAAAVTHIVRDGGVWYFAAHTVAQSAMDSLEMVYAEQQNNMAQF